MTEKREILHELGEEELLLPALVNAALRANDRIKYFFTLLQAARSHADNPGQSHSNLRAERESVGITDPDFDTVVGGATRAGQTGYAIPLAASVFKEISTAVEEMIAPLASQDPAGQKRLKTVSPVFAPPWPHPGKNQSPAVSSTPSRSRDRGDGTDSLHQLVMDLHKAINALQAQARKRGYRWCTRVLPHRPRPRDGACLHGRDEPHGPPQIRSLGPCNNRNPERGQTGHPERYRSYRCARARGDSERSDDYHYVYGYSPPAAPFLPEPLFIVPGAMGAIQSPVHPEKKFETPVYHLSVGTFAARDETDARDFLTRAGSRIVFLID